LQIAHELSSHLISQAYLFYSFPSHNIYKWWALYGAIWESLVLPRYYKLDVVKTRQASHGLTKTHQKGHWKIMLYQGGEEKNTHT
jgi:hypothetical protein